MFLYPLEREIEFTTKNPGRGAHLNKNPALPPTGCGTSEVSISGVYAPGEVSNIRSSG
jgi:hypothetical protein